MNGADELDAAPGDDAVTVPRATLDGILDRLAVLEARLAEPVAAPTGGGVDPSPIGTTGLLDRRRALTALVAGVAGSATVLAGARPAAAANGSPLILGNTANPATSPTGLAVQGTGVGYGIGVTDNGLATVPTSAAVLGHAKSQNFAVGVLGMGQGSIGVGVEARAEGGTAVRAASTSGNGLTASSGSSTGIVASTSSTSASALLAYGGRHAIVADNEQGAQLFLVPRAAPVTDPKVPADPGVIYATGGRLAGTGRVRSTLWTCVFTEGDDIRWRVLAGPTTAGSLHVLPVPARIYDSRPGTSPFVGLKAPLKGSEIRTLDLKVNGSTVPAGATAAVLTVLLVNAANASGNFTVWAGGAARPAANTMVWGGSAGRFCTTALTSLDDQARIQVSSSAPTNLVIDVVGYYR